MNRVMNVMKMHTKDKWGWFFVPWIILFFSFFINLIIGIISGGKSPIYTGGLASIYIYMFVAGLVSITQMFQFAIGLSVRRKDFYLGTAGLFISLSSAIAIVLFILSVLEKVSGSWGVNLHFFHLPYLSDGSVIEQLLINFVLMLNMFFLGSMISSVFQRFGSKGILILLGAIGIVVTILSFLCTYYEWWSDIFQWFTQHSAFEITMWTVPVIAVYMLVSYAFLKKATV